MDELILSLREQYIARMWRRAAAEAIAEGRVWYWINSRHPSRVN